jgi:mono/diheme cytochrome c family protein
VGRRREEEDGRQADDPSKVWTLDDILKRGEKVYAANCAACHQANGKGAGPIKPLDGAAVVLDADKAKQIAVLLNGQNNGAMPAWKQLSDTDIAAVITYTKNNWSNKTGQLVQPADVKAAAQVSPGPKRYRSSQKEISMSAVLDHHGHAHDDHHDHRPTGWRRWVSPPTTRTSARCTCCSRSSC